MLLYAGQYQVLTLPEGLLIPHKIQDAITLNLDHVQFGFKDICQRSQLEPTPHIPTPAARDRRTLLNRDRFLAIQNHLEVSEARYEKAEQGREVVGHRA